jgi:hypothetical protein
MGTRLHRIVHACEFRTFCYLRLFLYANTPTAAAAVKRERISGSGSVTTVSIPKAVTDRSDNMQKTDNLRMILTASMIFITLIPFKVLSAIDYSRRSEKDFFVK